MTRRIKKQLMTTLRLVVLFTGVFFLLFCVQPFSG